MMAELTAAFQDDNSSQTLGPSHRPRGVAFLGAQSLETTSSVLALQFLPLEGGVGDQGGSSPLWEG